MSKSSAKKGEINLTLEGNQAEPTTVLAGRKKEGLTSDPPLLNYYAKKALFCRSI